MKASESKWKFMESSFNGLPLLGRINQSFIDSDMRRQMMAKYPYRLIVGTGLTSPTAAGLPSVEEQNELDEAEDRIVAIIEEHMSGVYIFVSTGDYIRESVFYVNDPQKIKSIIEPLLSSFTHHQFGYHLDQDTEWKYYSQIIGS